MLNITNNQLNKKVKLTEYASGKLVFNKKYYKQLNRFLFVFAVVGIIILFLPWTQNITGQGQVTTLKPDQRPQTIQSQIPGRIEQWYVREGDSVRKGDTILRISEVKSEYFDDRLVERTNDQIVAKSSSVTAYKGKREALERQIKALFRERELKLEQVQNKLLQAKLKIKGDSIDVEAARINRGIAQTQYDRAVTLANEGLAATKDVEAKRLKLQETEAKLISLENKYLANKNDIINARIELSSTQANYADKISKAQSDLYTAQSSQFDTEAQVTKLENQYTNYKMRNNLRYILAPQDGFINKAIIGGIGETFKEGQQLVNIMPSNYELAVETYVRPIDLPLIHKGEKVRVQFDGWPAIVFSGWPNVSYGTYGAKVVAIENFISDNGKYRILLAPDETDNPWPDAIRVGSGARTIALLNDVPIWFELWRQLNSFPPDFYQPDDKTVNKASKDKKK
ncbi:multidrug resistance efflux pump [Kordia periserrulae]|uniref:Multidrug resistance efflux pump n=1 Tax=Kordia periserrulae TaxID=701523 RepID=A0A2T6C6E5_9FLAO|nr:HlyD family efflux transporter periplasmic adaptor subunit [Kordia periserrulae]PTX63865.1 multidrug resistance efflux pump [Kordia periserrulae]